MALALGSSESPIMRLPPELPPELLGKIFLWHVTPQLQHGEHCTLPRITHICRFWRHAALGHQLLWSAVVVTQRECLEEMLIRSGDQPLVVVQKWSANDKACQRYPPILIDAVQPHLERVKYGIFYLPESLSVSIMSSFKELPVTARKTLYQRSYSHHQLGELIIEDGPMLRHNERQLSGRNLKALVIGPTISQRCLDDWLGVLKNLSELETIDMKYSISRRRADDPVMEHQAIVLPNLVSLTLGGCTGVEEVMLYSCIYSAKLYGVQILAEAVRPVTELPAEIAFHLRRRYLREAGNPTLTHQLDLFKSSKIRLSKESHTKHVIDLVLLAHDLDLEPLANWNTGTDLADSAQYRAGRCYFQLILAYFLDPAKATEFYKQFKKHIIPASVCNLWVSDRRAEEENCTDSTCTWRSHVWTSLLRMNNVRQLAVHGTHASRTLRYLLDPRTPGNRQIFPSLKCLLLDSVDWRAKHGEVTDLKAWLRAMYYLRSSDREPLLNFSVRGLMHMSDVEKEQLHNACKIAYQFLAYYPIIRVIE